MEYISRNNEGFLEEYLSFREPLAAVFAADEEDQDKPEADPGLIKDAFEGLRYAAEEMDCDALQDIFRELEEYRIPEAEAERWKRLKEASYEYDYPKILVILDEN
ncbi:MAG: hypothetical protein K5985_05370 [Lachnospiraceae bacterium]|nr:hypothetical protein [Lachnospiraceae bacterium]